MAYFAIEQPGQPTVKAYVTASEVTLGRAEDNTIILVADEVSRHHAKVQVRPNNLYVLVDLNSLNGTYVNGQRIVERVLSDRDEIWMGSKCRLVFFQESPMETPKAANVQENRYVSDSVDIQQIRANLERVNSSLTLIGKTRQRPDIVGHEKSTISGEEMEEISYAYRRLLSLYKASTEVSKLIASNADLPTRLAKVLDLAITVTGAERGFVVLREEDTGSIRVHMARKMGQDLSLGSPSMGIAQRAIDTNEPVLMRDAMRDSEFAQRQSIVMQRISSAMCAPLSVENRVLGAVYVDSRRLDFSFTAQDLELFASVASQSALAIENVRLYQRMLEAEQKRMTLGRFLSPTVVDAIMSGTEKPELGGKKQFVTTMFCDIRGFTPIAEKLPPGDLLEILNEHFTAMVDIIFSAQGTLDKFIGDEIMAVFGAPIAHQDDARRAVSAAVGMLRKNRDLNEERRRKGSPTFELGIGVSTGEVIAGLVGSPQRMDFTVVGDKVNTARRLCSLASPSQIVLCETTHSLVKDDFVSRRIGTVTLKGKELPVRAYELIWQEG